MTIAEVQLVRKFVLGIAVLVGLAMFALTDSFTDGGTTTHEMIEWIGIVLMVTCILGRTWCTLYIGGRKIQELVTDGPYSVSRNPLYFFSILGAAGAGMQLGSVLAGIVFGAMAWLVFYVVVLQEEQLLAERYGTVFAGYQAWVPRFWPNPARWHDVPTVTVMPPKLLRTFADAMFFLLAVPIAEMCELLQKAHLLPVLVRLP
jgi:protein-S-isoprenylcysteine O-methyltransferase Ste14